MQKNKTNTWFVSVVAGVVLAGFLAVYYHHPETRQPVTDIAGERFDTQTMAEIRADLNQYDVAGTAHNHEVYMITGGLGITNPRILSWDSDGNMEFASHVGGTFYDIRQSAQSPARWSMQRQGSGVMVTNGPVAGYKPVPWVRKETPSGASYYQWDMIRGQITQFYFKEGETYIILKESMGIPASPKFPAGLINHVVSLGNPVS